MPTPIVDLSPQVCDAFDEGCLAVFKTRLQRPMLEYKSRDLLLRFTAHYRHLSALPRRMRRTLERRWKCTLSAIALLMTLGQTPALAANIQVSPGTPPAIKADGKCSLIEAIVNANRNARPHLDCVAGAGAVDTILLPANGQQQLKGAELLPTITSRIVIEGRHSTISRNTFTNLTFFDVSASGDLTLNETTVTGAIAGIATGGYGVSNQGHVALNSSSIADTGGLFNSGGVAVLNGSSVTGTTRSPSNYAYGGIQNRPGGTLIVTNSVISGNEAYFNGGGINNSSGATATITNSIVSDNRIFYEGSAAVSGMTARWSWWEARLRVTKLSMGPVSTTRVPPQFDAARFPVTG